MRSDFYVYIVFRPWNGSPCYVGKGSGNRWRKFSPSDRPNRHLLNIIARTKSLGLQLPVVKVRTELTEIQAFEFERAFILAIGRGDDGPLVNLSDGGDGPLGAKGRKQSVEEKEKRAASLRGQKRSEESKAKMSAWQIGRKMSNEAKAKMSAAAKARYKNPEERMKISSTLKRKLSTEERARLSEIGKLGAAARWSKSTQGA